MPQIGVWPFIGRTMVEEAHRVKGPEPVLQLPPQRHTVNATLFELATFFGLRHLTKA
jgi:hypothetical protein